MRRHLSFSNVVAVLALFIALGGSAYAAKKIITHQSQLAKGVVTNNKVARHTLGKNRIKKAAQEKLQGEQGPAGPPGPTNVRIAKADLVSVPACITTDVTGCEALASLTLGDGNWLVQAKLVYASNLAGGSSNTNRCGLVSGGALLDESRGSPTQSSPEAMSLTAAMTGVEGGTSVSLACTEFGLENLLAEDIKITALQVENLTS